MHKLTDKFQILIFQKKLKRAISIYHNVQYLRTKLIRFFYQAKDQ
jgi:hypothetical protein